jgi:hypothetical protein
MYLLPEFLSYTGVTYLFGNLWTRARKSRSQILNFDVGLEISVRIGGCLPKILVVGGLEFAVIYIK